MEIREILEVMDAMLDSAPSVPLSGGKVLIDAGNLEKLMSDLRANLPAELEEAKQTLEKRQQILTEANDRANAIIKSAEERARRLVDSDAITRQVKEQAKEVVFQAKNKSKEMRKASNEYAERTLRVAEQGLTEAIAQLRTAKAALRQQNEAQPAEPKE